MKWRLLCWHNIGRSQSSAPTCTIVHSTRWCEPKKQIRPPLLRDWGRHLIKLAINCERYSWNTDHAGYQRVFRQYGIIFRVPTSFFSSENSSSYLSALWTLKLCFYYRCPPKTAKDILETRTALGIKECSANMASYSESDIAVLEREFVDMCFSFVNIKTVFLLSLSPNWRRPHYPPDVLS